MFTESILFFIFGLVLYQLIKNRKVSKRLPPGPRNWPIIGSLIEMNSYNSKYPYIALAEMAKKYGNIMGLGFGVHYAVVVSSFDIIKEIFKRHETAPYRFLFPYARDRSLNQNLGIIWSSGTVWRDIRRFTMKTLRDLGYGKTHLMEYTMKEETNDIVDYIRRDMKENNGILKVDSHRFAATAVNIIWSLVGGCRFSPDDPRLQKQVKINNECVESMGYQNVYTTFPFLKTWFPKWSQYERHCEINLESQNFMRELIAEVKEKLKTKVDPEPTSFIEIFLNEIKKNGSDPQTVFTEDQLVIILMDLFLGGSETTSTTLTWAFLLLAINPEAQRKLRNEIRSTAPDGSNSICFDDLARMPYTRATMLEIFRRSNLVPMPAPRAPTEDIEYDGYIIPKGTALMYNQEAVFQDEIFWGDPKVFRPERFLDAKETTIIKEREDRIRIFGFGKRICIAETLALDSVFMYLVAIFGNFTFEILPGEELSPENPICGLTIMPHPFNLRASEIS